MVKLELEEKLRLLGKDVCIDERATLIQRNMIQLADKVIIGRYATIDASPKIKIKDFENPGIFIGKESKIGAFSILESVGGYIRLGEQCSVKEYCLFYGTGGLEIGNYVRIAAHVSIIAENHNFGEINIPLFQQGLSYNGIKIGDDVWIGTRAVILDGVTIGKGSVIGAGSVVTKDIPDYSVAFGNPAKVNRRRV